MIALDDNIEDHPKFVGLSNDAFALWVRCIGYCRRNLTDGFVPEQAAIARARCKAPKRAFAELLTPAPGAPDKAPLWSGVPGGFQVHDYLEWNPSRTEVEAKREQKRASAKLGGEASGEARRRRLGIHTPAKAEPNGEQRPNETEARCFASGSPAANPSSGSGSGAAPVGRSISETTTPPSLSVRARTPDGSGGGFGAEIEAAMRAHEKFAGLDVPGIAADLADGLAQAQVSKGYPAKTGEQIANDVAAAALELPRMPNEETVRRKLRSFVVGGGWGDRGATRTVGRRAPRAVQGGLDELPAHARASAAWQAEQDAEDARRRDAGEEDSIV